MHNNKAYASATILLSRYCGADAYSQFAVYLHICTAAAANNSYLPLLYTTTIGK
jgi:hypothetical protein